MNYIKQTSVPNPQVNPVSEEAEDHKAVRHCILAVDRYTVAERRVSCCLYESKGDLRAEGHMKAFAYESRRGNFGILLFCRGMPTYRLFGYRREDAELVFDMLLRYRVSLCHLHDVLEDRGEAWRLQELPQ